ncbi:MAG: hypothetical protein PVI91_05465 [Gammaproteobacteria bacterium]|jgi:hypothetical protein
MQPANSNSIKHREIGFRGPHADPCQASSAAQLLGCIDGVLSVAVAEESPNTLQVSYDLNVIGLRGVEALLVELGFHLDNTLLFKLKRALYYYTEDNEVGSRTQSRDPDRSTREVFVHRYRGKTHGCRDGRPDYWRKYL